MSWVKAEVQTMYIEQALHQLVETNNQLAQRVSELEKARSADKSLITHLKECVSDLEEALAKANEKAHSLSGEENVTRND